MQKTIYFPNITNNIWSYLLWSPVIWGGGSDPPLRLLRRSSKAVDGRLEFAWLLLRLSWSMPRRVGRAAQFESHEDRKKVPKRFLVEFEGFRSSIQNACLVIHSLFVQSEANQTKRRKDVVELPCLKKKIFVTTHRP